MVVEQCGYISRLQTDSKMLNQISLVAILMLLSSSWLGVEADAVPADIHLLTFGDLVQLARDGNADKRNDAVRSRQDKSFAALELPYLQAEVDLLHPTKANVFEHFTPKYKQQISGERKRDFSQVERFRQSKQRSSYVTNSSPQPYQGSAPRNKQSDISFIQQAKYWADRNQNPVGYNGDENKRFRIGDVATLEQRQDVIVPDAPPDEYKDILDLNLDDYEDISVSDQSYTNIQSVDVNNLFQTEFNANDVDAEYDLAGGQVIPDNTKLILQRNVETEPTAIFRDLDPQNPSNEIPAISRNANEKENAFTSSKDVNGKIPSNTRRRVLRRQKPKRKKANRKRQPSSPKVLNNIPSVLPNFLTDYSFINSLYNPNRARKQTRTKQKPVFEKVAEEKEKCIDKLEDVEEIEYDEVEECDHSYNKKCHTSYVTEYESQQEEECSDTFNKKCEISYEAKAKNETVEVCMNPLVKDCNLSGPEVCKTEYITECFTVNNPKIVVDDIPDCETVYDQKCETKQRGYTAEEECRSWPKQVCTVAQQIKKKFNPETKCEKVPQEICGPSGCGFVPGPEECYEKAVTIVTDVPFETCFLDPRRNCEQITKLVPLLTPVEECIDVPKETCHKVRGNPKKVVKQVKKKWCYKPSEESGLA